MRHQGMWVSGYHGVTTHTDQEVCVLKALQVEAGRHILEYHCQSASVPLCIGAAIISTYNFILASKTEMHRDLHSTEPFRLPRYDRKLINVFCEE